MWLPGVALCALLVAFEEVGVLLGAVGALEDCSLKDAARRRVLGTALLSSKAEQAVAQVATAKRHWTAPLNVLMRPRVHSPDDMGVLRFLIYIYIVPTADLGFSHLLCNSGTSKMGMK